MKNIFESFKTTIYFIVVLLFVHTIWKFGFVEDIDFRGNKILLFYGFDVTSFFSVFTDWLVSSVYWLLSVFSSAAFAVKNHSIELVSQGESIGIVWSCTGIKQAIFFILLVLCYPKQSLHKIWFIPAGVAVVFLINILRITGIVWLCDVNMNNFETLHELSKYIFYAILYGMWILWDWKIVPSSKE